MKNRIYLLLALITGCLLAGIFFAQWQKTPIASNPQQTSVVSSGNSNNPYALFGDSSTVLQSKVEQEQAWYLEIDNPAVENVKRLRLNFKTGEVTLFTLQGQTLHFHLKPTDLARFLSIDPLASKYPYLSPYNFVGNNPISYIDPDGREFIVADEAQRQVVVDYLKDQLGVNIFSFNAKGELQLDKKAYKAAQTSFNEDQAEIASGFFKIVKSNRIIETIIYENEGSVFKRNPIVQQEILTSDPTTGNITKSYYVGPVYTGEGVIYPIEDEGYTVAVKDDDRAFILINRPKSKTGTFEAEADTRTSVCESCIFIHEALDHGLDYINTGTTNEPPGATKKDNVRYHNRALSNKNSPLRTGKDHQ